MGFSREEAAKDLSARLREAEKRLEEAALALEREREAFEMDRKRRGAGPASPSGASELIERARPGEATKKPGPSTDRPD